MTDAPEWIWATFEIDVSAQTTDVYAQDEPEGFVGTPTKYIRADLAPVVTVKSEEIAKIIYERGMLFLRTELPDWVEGGNSVAQDEARAIAARILSAISTRSYADVRREALGEAYAKLDEDVLRLNREINEYKLAVMGKPSVRYRIARAERDAKMSSRDQIRDLIEKEGG